MPEIEVYRLSSKLNLNGNVNLLERMVTRDNDEGAKKILTILEWFYSETYGDIETMTNAKLEDWLQYRYIAEDNQDHRMDSDVFFDYDG